MGVPASLGFDDALAREGLGRLRRAEPRTLQVNVGKRCNQACHHCHVDAGPKRTEVMTAATAERVLEVLERNPALTTMDVTGGAPELNPSFRRLVERARALGRDVIVRCNLTIVLVDGMEWLAEFYRDQRVALVCSLPCYTEDNVDKQRGRGVFDGSIRALQRLNALGYGRPGSDLRLDLVYNPLGAFLPGPEAELAARYRQELGKYFTEIESVSCTERRASAPRLHEPTASAGIGLESTKVNAPSASGPLRAPPGLSPSTEAVSRRW